MVQAVDMRATYQVIWWRNLEDWEENFNAVSHKRARP